MADAGLVGPVLFVGAAGVLGLALFPGHVAAAASGLLFGALAGTALALAAALLGAGLCLFAARWSRVSSSGHDLRPLQPESGRWPPPSATCALP